LDKFDLLEVMGDHYIHGGHCARGVFKDLPDWSRWSRME
jgi:hypothetical protein